MVFIPRAPIVEKHIAVVRNNNEGVDGEGYPMPFAYYSFSQEDALSNGDLRPKLGNHVLTDTGAPPKVNGQVGTGRSFDGATEYYSNVDVVSGVTDFQFGEDDAFSISTWLYQAAADQGAIAGRRNLGSGTTSGWYYAVTSAGLLSMSIRRLNSTTTARAANSVGKVSYKVWNHIMVTYAGGSAASGFTFYINGSDAGSSIIYDVAPGTPSSTTDFFIGYRGAGTGTAYLDGSLNEMGFWDVELTSEEVTNVFNRGVAGKRLINDS